MNYQLLSDLLGGGPRTDMIKRINDDGSVSFIPNDPTNIDWQAYQEWLSEGNTPLPAA